MPLQVKIINKSNFKLPHFATPGSAGVDLYANLQEPVKLTSLERTLIPTGLFLEIPVGYEAQIRPRSGLSIKRGLTCVNAVGTIDSDYRGEIMVAIVNLSKETQIIEPGERVAQMIIAAYERFEWQEVSELNDSSRGEGGFGSTGTK